MLWRVHLRKTKIKGLKNDTSEDESEDNKGVIRIHIWKNHRKKEWQWEKGQKDEQWYTWRVWRYQWGNQTA